MPLVVVDEELARDAASLELGVELLGLRERHPRVVGPVDDDQGRADLVDAADRRHLLEELAVGREVAVLALAEGTTPDGGVLEERDEARDADDVDAGREELGGE